jgi:hypothetical protein
MTTACISVQYALLSELEPSKSNGDFLIRQPLMEYELNDFSLIGTCVSAQSSAALLLPNEETALIEAESLIGKNFGRVTEILPTSISVTEKMFDSAGNETLTPQVVELKGAENNTAPEIKSVQQISSSAWDTLVDTSLRQNGQLELDKKISLELNQVSGGDLLRSLEASTGATFYLTDPLPPLKISLSIQNTEARKVLEQVFLTLLTADLVLDPNATLVGGFYLRSHPKKAQNLLGTFKASELSKQSAPTTQINYPQTGLKVFPKILRCLNKNSYLMEDSSNNATFQLALPEQGADQQLQHLNGALDEKGHVLVEHKGELLIFNKDTLSL